MVALKERKIVNENFKNHNCLFFKPHIYKYFIFKFRIC